MKTVMASLTLVEISLVRLLEYAHSNLLINDTFWTNLKTFPTILKADAGAGGLFSGYFTV